MHQIIPGVFQYQRYDKMCCENSIREKTLECMWLMGKTRKQWMEESNG